jgi:hypothetical protein
MTRWALILIFVLCGCVSHEPATAPRFAFSYTDDPSRGRLVLSLTSQSSRMLCVTPANWPTSTGAIQSPEGRVWLSVDNVRYDYKDIYAGYCPDCLTRIRPGETLTAALPYANFEGLPSTSSIKSLHMNPTVDFCP